jgi:nucleotide-binding universal stress UspA family protein
VAASAPFPPPRPLLALVPGRSSDRAWASAAGLLRDQPGVCVCHVVLRPTGVAGDDLDGNPANDEEIAIVQALRGELVAHLGPSGRTVPIRILHGDPGQRICEYADFLDSGLIVLLRGGPPTLGKRLQGSVSKFVAGSSQRSVLLLGA